MTLVINNNFPAGNVREFVAQLKKQPGVVNYASPGIGSSQQLAMELFKQETGTKMLHVPYKGSAGALSDIVAGHVQASVASVQSASALIQSGKMRMLAVMGRERTPTFPQVPTFTELGYGNIVVETWYGVLTPAGTPPAVIGKMNTEIDHLLALPEVRETLLRQGIAPPAASLGDSMRCCAANSSCGRKWRRAARSSPNERVPNPTTGTRHDE